MNTLEQEIFRFVSDSSVKVTFGCLKKYFSASSFCRLKDLKSAVNGLMASGQLCYTFLYGRSFIELSYEKPLLVSPHVILKPPGCSASTESGQYVITIEKGASFGMGEHPTTRLAIQLIDEALHQNNWWSRIRTLQAIDIGTGSGVLAIVAAKIGVGCITGIDTDSCSAFEARQNVLINGVEDQVHIRKGQINKNDKNIDIVFANLRTPTLVKICDAIEKKTNENSLLILSGMKTEEFDSVGEHYQKAGLTIVEKRFKKDWAALWLSRG